MLNIPIPQFTILSLFKVDILIFAGIAFILIGILKRFNISNKKMLILAIIFSIIGSFVCFVDFNNIFLNYFFGYFIGTILHQCTVFPLFNWFIFPVAGMVYGSYFIRVKDKSQFFKLWPVFLIIPLIFILCNFTMLSKHVTGIYVAQWYFIPLFRTFIEYFYKGIVFTESSITLISIFILGISTLAALSYSKYKKIIN